MKPMRVLGYFLAAALFVVALTSDAACAFGADAKSAADPTQPIFPNQCQGWHGGSKPKGDFRLESLSEDFAEKENRQKWLKVAERLTAGTMPPKGKPRPPVSEAKAMTDWIDGMVATAATSGDVLQGRAVMRRLNQVEYENTVRDLLGVEVELKDLLPDDTAPGSFDTSAESLHMSSYQLDGYLAAASRVLDAAIAGGPRPAHFKQRIDVRNESATRRYDVYRHLDDGV